ADGLRVEVVGKGMFGQRLEAELTGEYRLAQRLLPTGVALVLELLESVVLQHSRSALEGEGEDVHPRDVAIKQVNFVEALPTHLGVEVEAAIPETAGLENLVVGQGHFFDTVGKLVGVPAVLLIAPVGVDAAEDSQRNRRCDFMVEAVAGEGGVIGLDIDLDFILQAEL